MAAYPRIRAAKERERHYFDTMVRDECRKHEEDVKLDQEVREENLKRAREAAEARRDDDDSGSTEPWGHWPFIVPDAFAKIPREAQPLFRHWCATEWVMTLDDAARSVAIPQL